MKQISILFYLTGKFPSYCSLARLLSQPQHQSLREMAPIPRKVKNPVHSQLDACRPKEAGSLQSQQQFYSFWFLSPFYTRYWPQTTPIPVRQARMLSSERTLLSLTPRSQAKGSHALPLKQLMLQQSMPILAVHGLLLASQKSYRAMSWGKYPGPWPQAWAFLQVTCSLVRKSSPATLMRQPVQVHCEEPKALHQASGCSSWSWLRMGLMELVKSPSS